MRLRTDDLLLVSGWTLTVVGTGLLLVACSSNAERITSAPVLHSEYRRLEPPLQVAPEPVLRCHSQACLEKCSDLYEGVRPKWCSSFTKPQ